MISEAPLIQRQHSDNIAWIYQSITSLPDTQGPITADTFLCHVRALATQLPDNNYCINLCSNRYLFMVAFCAALIRQQTNLFPSNKNAATQARLAERYDGCYLIHDGVSELAQHLDAFDISQLPLGELAEQCSRGDEMPMIALDHLAAITFTSGSTGDAKPIIKTWRTMVQSTAINQSYMQADQSSTAYYLATVPGQHMWGFETSVLMPLFANVCAADSRPLYPVDVFEQLKHLPSPKTLVTTPFHLKAMYQSTLPAIEFNHILIATAPLDRQLAKEVEQKFSTSLLEVYGCSEVGSMSIRSTAHTDQWTRFDQLRFQQNESGKMVVDADHLPEAVVLDDRLKMIDADHFVLAGRSSDQIEIAGKRGSLQEINGVLQRFEGLSDGVVIFPPQNRAVSRLVALVVLNEGVGKDKLKEHFRRYVDPAFVPRPIIELDQLPREENGKLIKRKLLQLYAELSKS